MLLRYHSPGFDDLALEERGDLIAETCAHINEFVEVLRKLMTFLEHGKPKRRGPTFHLPLIQHARTTTKPSVELPLIARSCVALV